MRKRDRGTSDLSKDSAWAVRSLGHAVALAALFGAGLVLAQPVNPDNPALNPAVATFFGFAHTTQKFSLMGNGGVLDVLSTDNDPEQIIAIRSRLRERGRTFVRGDIPSPALRSPDIVPALAELRAGAAHILVTFEELPTGGRISFTTQDPALIPALSIWLVLTTRESGADLRIGIPPDVHIPR